MLMRLPVLVLLGMGVSSAAGRVLTAADFGVVADGRTDDGPAIRRMVERARELAGEEVVLQFPKGRVVRVSSADESRYVLALERTEGVTVDGGGSTFVLAPDLRFADLKFARRPVMRNLQVDFSPHPFIDAVVEAVDPGRTWVDVRCQNPADAAALGGPTGADGEQAFIGFVWCENGPHPKAATHFTVKSAEVMEGGRVRVSHEGAPFSKKGLADRIKPGVTRISLPRPGVAHRRGPGALFRVHDTVDARLEKTRVWGAPWFCVSIYRNEGTLVCHDVDVVPKPGSGRLMAAGRDAFHVTANRAKMIFDGCDTAGLGDDDYNFCVLSASVREVLSPARIVIRQKFPIQYNPMRVGETLMVMDSGNTMVGSAVIAGYEEGSLPGGERIENGGRCPLVTVTLKEPIPGLAKGQTVWAKEAANPDTVMRNCRASFSCRLQTSLVIEDCVFRCYNVAYGMDPKHLNVEGPGPRFLRISDSVFEVGRGKGLRTACGGSGPLKTTRIQDVQIENCIFRAPLHLTKVRRILLRNNQFSEDPEIGACLEYKASGNQLGGKPIVPGTVRAR